MIKLKSKLFAILIGLASLIIIPACTDEDPPLPDNLVVFETDQLGFGSEQVLVTLSLSRAAADTAWITLGVTPKGVTYGVEFETDPSVEGNELHLRIPAGQVSTSFIVTRDEEIFWDGDESVSFTITEAQNVVVGEKSTIEVKFSAIVSEGSELQLLGRSDDAAYTPANTINYANTVYADLSANTATRVNRKSWNLAFYGGEEFKVALNPNFQTTAAALTKTDITTVTLEDANTIANLDHANPFPAGNHDNVALVDYYDGDLTKLVFDDVSATDANNKVYLVSFEGNKAKETWYKVKVSRNGEGYRVQYALIGATEIKTIDVPKNENYNFTFVSLVSNQIVSAEPQKSNWDIVWGYSTYLSVTDNPNSEPYWYQDFVALNNVAGAQAAEVVKATAGEAEAAYEAFTEADLTGITFSSNRDAIGSKWRVTSGGTAGIKRDRFYVLKDPHGNIYKLKFVSMGLNGDGGERGKPVIAYVLVKKAE